MRSDHNHWGSRENKHAAERSAYRANVSCGSAARAGTCTQAPTFLPKMLLADTQSDGWCVRCSALNSVRWTGPADNRNQQFVRRTTYRSSARDGPECRGGGRLRLLVQEGREGLAVQQARVDRVRHGPCEPGSPCGPCENSRGPGLSDGLQRWLGLDDHRA
jgi:hypothetical protein